jgi:hypothetical protein
MSNNIKSKADLRGKEAVAEVARIKAILNHRAAAGCEPLALHLALNTDSPLAEAGAILFKANQEAAEEALAQAIVNDYDVSEPENPEADALAEEILGHPIEGRLPDHDAGLGRVVTY